MLLTIVEHYVMAAMKHAGSEQLEDGTIAATVPECPGVVAFGADHHECATELYARLEDWVKVSLAAGYKLPVIEGIDLNTEASQILATYHDGEGTTIGGEFYPDEAELEAAFEARSKRT
ncbi:MAG: type II toxin-antitoxin system HicB family antitoxin [Dehalococcoidia bacterium]